MTPSNNKVKWIIVIFGVVFIAVIAIAVYIQWRNQSSNESSIKNYSDYVKNIPSSERAQVQAALKEMLEKNNPGKDVGKISDITIRKDSYSQALNKETGIYASAYIVDIPSLKQSYQVESQATATADSSDAEAVGADYTTMVLCLDKKDLLYGNFACKDRISDENNLPYSDPVENVLPYNGNDFSASYNGYDKVSNRINIQVLLYVNTSSNDPGMQQIYTQYRDEAKQWLEDQGLDLNNYNISYS